MALGRRNWRSPCRIPVLRRARRQPTLKRWYGQGLRGLRWILRSRGAWPSLARCGQVCMAPSGAHHSCYGRDVDCFGSPWLPRGVDWWGFFFSRQQWALGNRGCLCQMVSWRPLNRKFKWLLAYLLVVKWSLAFHKRFAWLVADVKLECLMRIGNVKFLALKSGGAKLMQNFSHWDLVVRSWCEIFHIGFAWRIGGAKIFALSSHGVHMENWWCETDAKFFALSSHWGLAVRSWCKIFRIGFTLSSGDANFFALRMADAKCSVFLCFWLPPLWT